MVLSDTAEKNVLADLQKIGLTEREAKVYLVLLVSGAASVQTISRRTSIARGTVYLVLETLRQRGLVTTIMRQRRRLFTAERPERLLAMLRSQQGALEHLMTEVRSVLPVLNAMRRSPDQGLSVRYYRGAEGLLAMRQEMVMYSQPKDVWRNITPVDYLPGVFGSQGIVCSARIKKGIISKTIDLTRSPELRRQLLQRAREQHVDRRFILVTDEVPTCGVTICRERVAVGCYGEAVEGMIVESPPLAGLLRKLFTITWDAVRTD